jgi:hypothetical protein
MRTEPLCDQVWREWESPFGTLTQAEVEYMLACGRIGPLPALPLGKELDEFGNLVLSDPEGRP